MSIREKLNLRGINSARSAERERFIRRLLLIGYPAAYLAGLAIGYMLFR